MKSRISFTNLSDLFSQVIHLQFIQSYASILQKTEIFFTEVEKEKI